VEQATVKEAVSEYVRQCRDLCERVVSGEVV